jgi:hypothetical protein
MIQTAVALPKSGRGYGRAAPGMLAHSCSSSGLTYNTRQVQVMSTLPLKALSRIWGRFNELTIPYYLRVPGFKLYSFIFGVK